MHAPEKEYCKVNAESHGAPTLLRPFASAGVEEKFKLPDPLKSWRERNSILAEAPHFFSLLLFWGIYRDHSAAILHLVGERYLGNPEPLLVIMALSKSMQIDFALRIQGLRSST